MNINFTHVLRCRCGLVVRVPGYRTEMYCVSCEIETEFEVQTELICYVEESDRLCGLVVTVLGYRNGGPGSIPGNTMEKKVVGLERGLLSL
jgi:hypothetical protein